MRGKLLCAIVLAGLLLVLSAQVSHATPSPPYILVNESTRECYVSIMNDECFSCDPPQGWKILGTGNLSYGRTDCPAGYQKIDRLELNCTRYKTPFCCGMFSSHGDCEDMVVNATQRACAFVNDIHGCILPAGWSGRPTDVAEGNWSCNFNSSQWVDNVSCLTAPPTAVPLVVANVPIPRPAAQPVIGIGLIVLGGGTLIWLGRRRGKH